MLLGLTVVGALLLRWPDLNHRPLHNDEAVNAIKFKDLWEQGRYAYDPEEYHGPTLYYLTLPLAQLSGAKDFRELTETPLRLVPLAFGIALILALPLLGSGLSRGALLGAAVWTALSPAMVFYSRYYIHELILVFFTFVVLAACWRYLEQPRLGWALLAGAGVGLMYATKETFVIQMAALGLAFMGTWAWAYCEEPSRAAVAAATGDRSRASLRCLGMELKFTHLAAAAAAMLVVSVVLFSSFFTHWSGVVDAVKTYLPMVKRASGHSPHIHPWYFYLERLAWFHVGKGPVFTELMILVLALIGAGAAFLGRGLGDTQLRLARVLAIYTLCLALAYSVISYKTPWCFLGFWHGAILLAGIGTMVLIQLASRRWMRAGVALLLAVGAVHLAREAWQSTHEFEASRLNPCVYGHTSTDILKLVDKVEGLAQVHPQHHDMVIKVMAKNGDYWPLPWYLRRFTTVDWWDNIPVGPKVPVVIYSSAFEANLDAKEPRIYLMAGMFQLRPKEVFELYVETDLWKAYVPTIKRAEEE